MSEFLARGLAWAAALVGFLLVYGRVLAGLVRDWATDDNYSHGFIILPLALYFAWERRHQIAAAEVRPSPLGLIAVVAGLGVFFVGQLGAELFLARTSMLMVLAGVVLFLRGWRTLGLLGFPLAFLLLMIPIPAIIFNGIAFPLQLLASRAGEAALSLFGIPVLREGNLIVLANTTLEVAEACSGIRSLISLLTLGVIYGYFVDGRGAVRTIVTLATIPIAVAANGLRVAGTGIAAHYFGAAAAEGFFHTFSGWLMFGFAFLVLFGLTSLMLRAAPPPGSRGTNPSAVPA